MGSRASTYGSLICHYSTRPARKLRPELDEPALAFYFRRGNVVVCSCKSPLILWIYRCMLKLIAEDGAKYRERPRRNPGLRLLR